MAYRAFLILGLSLTGFLFVAGNSEECQARGLFRGRPASPTCQTLDFGEFQRKVRLSSVGNVQMKGSGNASFLLPDGLVITKLDMGKKLVDVQATVTFDGLVLETNYPKLKAYSNILDAQSAEVNPPAAGAIKMLPTGTAGVYVATGVEVLAHHLAGTTPLKNNNWIVVWGVFKNSGLDQQYYVVHRLPAKNFANGWHVELPP